MDTTDIPNDSPDDKLDAVLATGEVPAELRIVLSSDALAEAERLAREEASYRDKPLRVYVEGKGCDGFYYGVAFDERGAGDLAWTQGSIEIVVDPESLRFMRGSRVEWVDDERGRGFLVDNPHHRKFRGKFYKRKSWQELLVKKTKAKGQPH